MTTYVKSKNFFYSYANSGRIILNILIIVAIISLGSLYLMQTNGVVGQGYQIRDLKERVAELQAQNQKLQIETARLQFPANLEEIAQQYNMIKADNVTYLKESSGVAAAKSHSSN